MDSPRWQEIHENQRKSINHNFKLKSRLCGFIAGDGNISMSRFLLRLFPDHESLINPLVESIVEVYNKKPLIRKNNNFFTISLSSKVICEDLINICNFGTRDWEIPFNLFESKNDEIEWLRSFFDAEAHVNLSRCQIKINSVNESGLKQIKDSLLRFNIHSAIYNYTPKNIRWSKVFILIIYRKNSLKNYRGIIGFNHSIKMSKLYKLI
jgi:intein/homing endonuclease